METFSFRLLGPLSVRGADGSEIPLRGDRRRHLLARLLLSAGAPLTPSQLATDIYGDSNGRPPVSTVQSHISILRQLLGYDRIVTTDRGYLFTVGEVEVDIRLFERDAEAGRAAAAAGDHAAASEAFATALGRWAGEALADVRHAPWATAEAVRLDELRAGCLEERVRSLSEAGSQEEAIATAEAALVDHPLREGLWAALMLAFYRSGRQADALRAYQRLRHRLRDDLGIEPGPGVADLEAAILRQDPALRAAPTRAGRPGAPLRRRVARPLFVGRLAETGSVLRTWEELSRSVILVCGEPGIGKTALARRVADELAGQGALVAWGRSDEGGLTPYQPLQEAFAELAGGTGAGEAGLPWAPGAAPAGTQTPWSGADAERHRLFRAVESWFAAVAGERPVLLVLDDLHWADAATVLLVRHLVRSDATARTMVMVTLRDGEVDGASALLPALVEWQARPDCLRVNLAGLSPGEVGELLDAARSGRGAWRGSPAELHLLTDGHPFFIQQLLRSGPEGSALTGDAAARSVPAAVKDLVLLQTARLPADTRRLLSAASACAGAAELSLLEAATGLSGPGTLEAVERAVTADVLVAAPGGRDRYAFAHEMARRAVYQQMSATRAARLHNRLGRALEASAPPGAAERLGEIAYQYLAGSAVADADRAVRYATEAAAQAMGQGAYEVARDLLAGALDARGRCGDISPSRAELLVALGRAHTAAGSTEAGREAFLEAAELAEGAGRPDVLADAAVGYGGQASVAWEADSEHLELLERAALAATDPLVRARLQGRLAQSLRYASSSDRPDALSAEAVAAARRGGDPSTLAECLLHRFWTIYGPGRAAACLDLASEVVDLGEELGDPELRIGAAQCLIHAALELGDMATAERAAAVQEREARRLRQPQYLRLVEINSAMCAALRGRFEEAEDLAESARARSVARSQGEAFVVFAAQLCAIRWQQGRLGELREILEKAHAGEPERPVWQAGLCWVHAEGNGGRDGSPAEARPYLDMLTEEPLTSLPTGLHWWPTIVGGVLAAEATGSGAAAARLAEVIEPLEDHLACAGQAVVLGSAQHYLGLAASAQGDLDAAAARLEEAAGRHLGIGSPPLRAMSLASLAGVLDRRRRPGDRAAAVAAATEALSGANALGMAGVERRCRRLLSGER